MAEGLDFESLVSQLPTSFATCSLGAPSTPLPDKLRAIASAGFKGIELAFPDLVAFASKFHGKEIKEDEYAKLYAAGQEVRKLCEELGLQIMMLQPFSNFEGWKIGTKEREDAMKRAAGWIEIMEAIGAEMIQVRAVPSLKLRGRGLFALQVGSTDSEGITSDKHQLAQDLAALADLLNVHGFRLAYENWCW